MYSSRSPMSAQRSWRSRRRIESRSGERAARGGLDGVFHERGDERSGRAGAGTSGEQVPDAVSGQECPGVEVLPVAW